MDTIINIVQLVGIMGLMLCDITFFVFLQGDVNDYLVFYFDYVVFSFGFYYYSRGL